jgi:hypothetical protein
MKTKIVSYLCGNSYFMDCEKVLYNQHKSRTNFNYLSTNDSQLYDEIWSIPQMVNTNQHYWSTLYRTKCIEVPFVWSNKAIMLSALTEKIENENDLLYKNRGNSEKKIAIFEPNISMMKWAFPSVLVCENAYRKEKKIDKIFINNISDKKGIINDFNIDAFNKIVRSLDLFHDKKLTIEGRFNTLYFMSKHADIAVSHQWENPLNYLYLDLAWMGWPVVHNAHLCKDIGYYYDQFNYEMGGQVLLDAILHHDSHADEYIKKNRQIIDRYLPTNKELQNNYKKIIDQLFLV